jgi:hypothetical protein
MTVPNDEQRRSVFAMYNLVKALCITATPHREKLRGRALPKNRGPHLTVVFMFTFMNHLYESLTGVQNRRSLRVNY